MSGDSAGFQVSGRRQRMASRRPRRARAAACGTAGRPSARQRDRAGAALQEHRDEDAPPASPVGVPASPSPNDSASRRRTPGRARATSGPKWRRVRPVPAGTACPASMSGSPRPSAVARRQQGGAGALSQLMTSARLGRRRPAAAGCSRAAPGTAAFPCVVPASASAWRAIEASARRQGLRVARTRRLLQHTGGAGRLALRRTDRDGCRAPSAAPRSSAREARGVGQRASQPATFGGCETLAAHVAASTPSRSWMLAPSGAAGPR